MDALDDYRRRLQEFDWWYNYSDDGNVWRRGEAKFKALKDEAKSCPEKARIFVEEASQRGFQTGEFAAATQYPVARIPAPEGGELAAPPDDPRSIREWYPDHVASNLRAAKACFGKLGLRRNVLGVLHSMHAFVPIGLTSGIYWGLMEYEEAN